MIIFNITTVSSTWEFKLNRTLFVAYSIFPLTVNSGSYWFNCYGYEVKRWVVIKFNFLKQNWKVLLLDIYICSMYSVKKML
jgi:hypothetical protein